MAGLGHDGTVDDDNVIRFPTSTEPPERTLLRVADIDLELLAEALNDNGGHITWLFDLATGEVLPEPDRGARTEEADEFRFLSIFGDGSRDGYRDMERFASNVGVPALRNRLERALEGRGAFRRFRDELHAMPESYAKRWHAYAALCNEARAIEWLRAADVVDPADAESESAKREQMAVAILDELEAEAGLQIDVADVPTRWSEIVAAVDRGDPVTVVRDGEPFALVARDE